MYPKTDSNPNFPEIEKYILQYWKEDDTFNKSIKGKKNFNFYDGPPFANGLPHYGHLLTGYIKDIYARFQTQLGKKVERRFGWDCHGLPAEMGAEKELGISGKIAIEEFGIKNFNDYCKSSVLKYTSQWEYYVERQGRWVDFHNSYKTMDITYMESVIWAFKQLYDKGLIYQSYRVMPYSWACQTPVSDFETRMDNSYRQKISKAVTVRVKIAQNIKNIPSQHETYILIWTTTPWTLPSNLAIAVGKDIEYCVIDMGSWNALIAKDLMEKYAHELKNGVTLCSIMGSDLVGLKYEWLFDYFKSHANSFQILHADFVTTSDGTGAVHIAPGFGEDDQALCNQHNIQTVCPVDAAGKFMDPITEFIGMQVFDANDIIIKTLKEKSAIIKTEQYTHNYPHCWRTDTPLIYKALPSWYVKVTAFKDKMVQYNQEINWVPSHIKDGMFGKWLSNARDWSISRNRYWGCPIPIWMSDDNRYPNIEVYGSIAEIEAAFGTKVTSLHKPYIDDLVRPNPKDPTGQSMMRRVPDVLDCWFESGAMPFAQIHYPFENKEWFNQNFPADFITEYQAQTRGWFYTLLVLSTALFDRPPFLNCQCHGVILGNDGQKLSKRLRNYPDPALVFDELGADAMRWFMASSGVMKGYELVMNQDGIKDALRLAIKPFWNAYHFFCLYANADGITAQYDLSSGNILDRYIVNKCILLSQKIYVALQNYDSNLACSTFEGFIDSLNNWYIRRSRERFWSQDTSEDKICAYNTLYSVLIILCKSVASLMPMLSEHIYQGLNPSSNSVHLQMYPEVLDMTADQLLINKMERVRNACNVALSIRNEVGIKVRQPLQSVTFIGVSNEEISDELKTLVLQEINVKEWINLPQEQIVDFANFKLQIHFPIVGKRIPGSIKKIIQAQKENAWKHDGGKIYIADEVLQNDEFKLLLEPQKNLGATISSLPTNDGLVMLNTNIDEALRLEGDAREIVRAVQQARKELGLDISDKILLHIETQKIDAVITNWAPYIQSQTMAESIALIDQQNKLRFSVALSDDNIVEFAIKKYDKK